MFWTPYHLHQFENLLEKLALKNATIYLSPVQVASVRELLKYKAFNQGVEFPNIVEGTKDTFDENTYNVYKDVSKNEENGLEVIWNEEQNNIVSRIIENELNKHSNSWSEYKENPVNTKLLKQTKNIQKAIEKTKELHRKT